MACVHARSPSPARRLAAGAALITASLLAASPPAPAQESAAPSEQGRFLGAKDTVYPDWFKQSFLDLDEDVREAAAQGKRLLVVFHQDGCPYCNRLIEHNLSQADIRETMRRKFDVVAINMWGDREVVTVGGAPYTEKSLAEALKVQFTPTLLFFDEQGKVILRLNGYLPPPTFKLALQYVTEGREKQHSYAEFIAAAATPTAGSGGRLVRQPFFRPPPFDLSRALGAAPLAVFFEQTQCPNCQTLHDKVLDDTETRRVIEAFHAIQLDMWSDTPVITPDGRPITAREWARELNVGYAPTIVLFDTQGREVIRSEAFFKVFHTQSLFDYVASGEHRHWPSFQRYLSERADGLRERGVDVDIWR